MNHVRMMCITILIIASVLSVGHAETIDQIEDIKVYFPMAIGNLWTYEDVTGVSYTTEVTDCSKENEDTNVCTFLDAYHRGLQPTRHYRRYAFRGESLFILGTKLKDRNWQSENSMELKSPLKTGDMWEAASGSNQISKYRIVEILPTMQVKAGAFNNVIMVERRDFIKGKQGATGYYYYAPNVGLIGLGGKPDAKERLLRELTEFRSADPKE